MKNTSEHIENITRRWIDGTVVGHNLCPFAKPVLTSMRLTVHRDASLSGLLVLLGEEVIRLMETSPGELPTTIVIVPEGLDDFERYLDVLSMLEALLDDIGCAEELQVASFHPQYVFEGSDETDPANWTNRSPFPMFHFLRTADVAQAVEGHPDIDAVPQRNVDLFRRLGIEHLKAELAACYSTDPSSTN